MAFLTAARPLAAVALARPALRRALAPAVPLAPLAPRGASVRARSGLADDAERAKRDAQRTSKDVGDMVRGWI